ncbi:MAG: hypothetical protein HXX09_02690 [Bacteroidetes bacterium]|nr:hypothetical protein [Bacteroidota bacterium]
MKNKKIFFFLATAFFITVNLFGQKGDNANELFCTNSSIEMQDPGNIVVRDDFNYETTTPVRISKFILKESDMLSTLTNSTLEVIPVLSTNNIQINIKNEIEEYYIIEFFNKTGSSFYHKTIKSNSFQKKVDLSSFPKGIYTLKISSQFGNLIKYYSIEQL